MAYFTHNYLQFFKELAPNNNRDWFQANKKRYETHVKHPFEHFVTQLIDRLGKDDESLKGLLTKECIFRINRDIRFSKEKEPYKLQMSAIIANGGRKHMDNPGLYLELTPEHLGIYSGAYMPEKEQLNQIRTYISKNLSKFEKLHNDAVYRKYFSEGIQGEKNKILPAALKEAAATEPLLFNKQFYWYAHLPAETILKENLNEIIADHYTACRPLVDFFKKALNK